MLQGDSICPGALPLSPCGFLKWPWRPSRETCDVSPGIETSGKWSKQAPSCVTSVTTVFFSKSSCLFCVTHGFLDLNVPRSLFWVTVLKVKTLKTLLWSTPWSSIATKLKTYCATSTDFVTLWFRFVQIWFVREVYSLPISSGWWFWTCLNVLKPHSKRNTYPLVNKHAYIENYHC